MEIAFVSPTSIKLKGKQSSFIVDPTLTRAKQQADASLVTGVQAATDASGIEGNRVILSGPGDYEIGGIKIVGVRNNVSVQYYLTLDGIQVMVGAASGLKGKDLREAQVVALFADDVVEQSALASLNASVVIFYGERADEDSKSLGKSVQEMTKYAITKDKLPAEVEVIVLR